MTTQITDSGIYKITSPTGKIYIGQSTNIQKRWTDYKKKNCKRQPRLFQSFKKHGVENHTFEIVELCSVEMLNKRERHFQEKHNVIGRKGLNCVLTDTNEKPRIYSDEIRKKMSDNRKGKNTGENNHNFGTKLSEQRKQWLKFLNTGKKYSDSVNKSKGRKGRKVTKETREKMSIASMGRNEGLKNKLSKILIDLETGIFYESMNMYCEIHNENHSTMRYRVKKNKISLIYC